MLLLSCKMTKRVKYNFKKTQCYRNLKTTTAHIPFDNKRRGHTKRRHKCFYEVEYSSLLGRKALLNSKFDKPTILSYFWAHKQRDI